jgi:hypothetical protein
MLDKVPDLYANHNKRGLNGDAESNNPKKNQIIIGMDAVRIQSEGSWSRMLNKIPDLQSNHNSHGRN